MGSRRGGRQAAVRTAALRRHRSSSPSSASLRPAPTRFARQSVSRVARRADRHAARSGRLCLRRRPPLRFGRLLLAPLGDGLRWPGAPQPGAPRRLCLRRRPPLRFGRLLLAPLDNASGAVAVRRPSWTHRPGRLPRVATPASPFRGRPGGAPAGHPPWPCRSAPTPARCRSPTAPPASRPTPSATARPPAPRPPGPPSTPPTGRYTWGKLEILRLRDQARWCGFQRRPPVPPPGSGSSATRRAHHARVRPGPAEGDVSGRGGASAVATS